MNYFIVPNYAHHQKGVSMRPPDSHFSKNRILFSLWPCLACCGLTLLILAVVYALRGIWPFGTENIAYVDTVQFYLPDYYSLWDTLHGANRNINWFSGLIEDSNASLSALINPVNWVFLLVSRDHILEGLSLYLAAWLVIVALIASLVVSIRFRHLPFSWKVLLPLAYTFSGFVLQYYSNFSWLWITALFPLMLWFLELLWRDGNYLPYAVLYTYYLYYLSIYFTYMVTIYILLFSLAYCLFVCPKELRGDRILRLGLSTAAAFCITVPYWVGESTILADTSRFQSNLDSGLITGFTTWNITNTRHTVLMLLGTAFVFALLVRALWRQRTVENEAWLHRSRCILFFAFLLGMLAIPMIFTNIDTAWHFGQYNFFPMRYGYMIPATLLAAAGLCLQEEQHQPNCPVTGNNIRLTTVSGTISALLLVWLAPKLWPIFQQYGTCFLTSLGRDGYWKYFALLVCCGFLFFVLYLALFHLKKQRLSTVLTAAVLLLQLGSNAYALLAPDDGHVYTNEYDPAYVEKADSLYDYLSQQDISPLSRFKNVDNSLSASYPNLAGVSSAASVNSSNSGLRLGVFRELGYTVNYFRIVDTGGTVFSDMLFGVQNVLSAEELDSSLYTDTGITVDGIRIGTANYPGYIGLTYDNGALDNYLDYLTIPDRLNALYKAFTGADKLLAREPACVLTAQDDGVRTYTLTVTLEGESFLYLASDSLLMNITADGQAIAVPTYQNTTNTVYPAAFNSNLLYMGCFEAGSCIVQFMSAVPLTEDSFTLVALDKENLDSFYADAAYDPGTTVEINENSIRLTCTSESAERSLFLPISYSGRWQCSVNGQAVSPQRVMGVLMSVPLQAGENEIVLTRGPSVSSFTWKEAFSLISLGLCLVWLFLSRNHSKVQTLQLPVPIHTSAVILFYLICAAILAFIYIIPTILLITQGTIVGF